MTIETDEEFLSMMRDRFASKPYSGNLIGLGPEYWTDEKYDELIRSLLETQREIRAAASAAPPLYDGMTAEAWDRSTAQWAVWSIVTHDVGATPTPWHRVWSAIQGVIALTRADESRRIAEALRRDHAVMVGPTAADLIESAIARDVDCGD